jgi:hypothetical protein
MNCKKKIGLNTFYGLNYGSNLQCYATKSFVESLGYQCDLLKIRIDKYAKIKKALKIILKILFNPSYLVMRYKLRHYRTCLSDESAKLMNNFVSEILKPQNVDLRKLSESSLYTHFITGSDQIWNVSYGVNPVDFLQFAPREKKIALATSFGISDVPKYARKALSNALNSFNYISVREETGVNIVKQYSQTKVCRIADPTFIYNAEEWRNIVKNAITIKKKYILIHFLDEPNQTAVESISWLSEHLDLDIVAIGYKYNVFNNLKRYSFLDGGPWEYVSLIDQAEFVLTDSFHSVLFSINFRKRFFIFERQYTVTNQSSRICDLLKRFDLESHFIKNIGVFKKAYLDDLSEKTDVLLNNERTKIRDYIKKSISNQVPQIFKLGENNG